MHRYGDQLVAEVGFDGTVVAAGDSDVVTVEREGGALAVTVRFFNVNPFVFIGAARNGPVYGGDGGPQFDLRELSVAIEPVPPADRLRIVDVGAAGGLQLKWTRLARLVSPTLFEANDEEAARTRVALGELFEDSQVIATGLSHRDGPHTLHIARAVACTSVLEPNPAVLRHYRAAGIFETERSITVPCARYDTLHAGGLAPQPDVLKIDVQGYEYQVLQGFGGLLQGVLGVELESHLYPIYRDQKLLGDLVALLDGYGLVLRAIRPVPNFEGDIVEVDAFFTRRRSELARLPLAARRKAEIIEAVCGLPEDWPRAEG